MLLSICLHTQGLNTFNTVTNTMLNLFTPFDYTHMDWPLWMLSLTQSWICLLHLIMHRSIEYFEHCHWHNVESVHSIWSHTHQLNTLNPVTDTMLNLFTPYVYTHMDWTLWTLSPTMLNLFTPFGYPHSHINRLNTLHTDTHKLFKLFIPFGYMIEQFECSHLQNVDSILT